MAASIVDLPDPFLRRTVRGQGKKLRDVDVNLGSAMHC